MAADTPAEVVIHYRLRAGNHDRFLQVQAGLSAGLAYQDSYLGLDNHLDPHRQSASQDPEQDWTFVRHFRTATAAQQWAASPQLAAAHAELAGILIGEPTTNVLLEPAPRADGAAVISSRVRPGSEDWFLRRQGEMAAAQAQFPGYLGQQDQAPIPGVNPKWVSVIAYDTAEHLQAWLDSPQRAAFLTNTEGHVESYECRPAASAFESWFASVETDGAPPPPAWKLNAIVLLVLYPVVMAEIIWLNPRITGLGVSLGTFLGNIISVAATGFILIPIASRVLSWWLVPEAGQVRATNWRGAALLAVCYAACVAFFQWLTTLLGF